MTKYSVIFLVIFGISYVALNVAQFMHMASGLSKKDAHLLEACRVKMNLDLNELHDALFEEPKLTPRSKCALACLLNSKTNVEEPNNAEALDEAKDTLVANECDKFGLTS